MNKFLEINQQEITDNVFRAIGKDWMLITAGKEGDYNTMTASWGGLGTLWNADVAFAFVRPSRHTYGFMERERYFSLSFFDSGYRRSLIFCGANSGRDCDKATEAGILPLFDAPAPYFNEARLVLVCKKNYYQDLQPAHFLDPTIATHYEKDGLHRMYVGEIVKVLVRQP